MACASPQEPVEPHYFGLAHPMLGPFMPGASRSDRLIALALAFLALFALGTMRSPRVSRPRTQVTGATGAFGETRSSDEPLSLQQARALERGRGRQATTPD